MGSADDSTTSPGPWRIGRLGSKLLFGARRSLSGYSAETDIDMCGSNTLCVNLEVGVWFGERCLFDPNAVRPTSVVAQVESDLAAISREDFFKVMASYPRMKEHYHMWEVDLKQGKIT